MKGDYIKYFASLILFGMNGIVASFINLNSYEIVLLRTLLGSAFLLLMFFAGRKKFSFYKYGVQMLFLAVSGIAMGASWMLLYEAYARIGVGVATLCYYCGPVIVMVLSPFVFKERLTAVKVAAFALVMAGTVLVSGRVNSGSFDGFGFFCAVMSAVTYSFMVIFNKKAKDIKGLENSLLQLFVSFLTVTVFVAVKQGFAVCIASSDVLPVLILGIVNTGVGCYLYFSSIGGLPVQTVAVCGYTEPMCAVLFSFLCLGERMSLWQIAGAVLIIGSAAAGEIISAGRKRA